MSLRVVVTGGGSGLGRALVEAHLRRGDRVVLTDVDAARVDEARNALAAYGDVEGVVADVRSDADWDALVAAVEARWGGVDRLYNNAGVAAAGRFERIPMQDWAWILDINLLGVVRGCRAFTPMLRRQGAGALVNVASLAAVANGPGMASYNVAKAGVVALSETLRAELSPDGVAVHVVCPSFFPTRLGEGLRSPDADLARRADRMLARGRMTADGVAAYVIAAVDRGAFLILPHAEARWLHRLKRWMPWAVHLGALRYGRRLAAERDRAP
jgi:NAD(P)-dependent dehydrogenase (short-subunit alcohol dehydrogenase family)